MRLQETFIHIRGVGEKREAAIWRRGVADWDAALAADLTWLRGRAPVVLKASEVSLLRMRIRDAAFFSERLPGHQRLRLYEEFAEETAFLDIETDPARITLIGVCRGGRYRVFMRGADLEEFRRHLEPVKLVVTYNGSGFDLPVILRSFYRGERRPAFASGEYFNPPRGVHLPGSGHIDLMTVLHRRGIRGGLKASEEQLGIARPPEVAGMDGFDAVALWERYRRDRDRRALDLLVEYNRQDVMNLKRILERILDPAFRAGAARAPDRGLAAT